jgi:hypothetical protein
VRVSCRNPDGTAVDSQFTLTYVSGMTVTGDPGMEMAYLWSDDPAGVDHVPPAGHSASTGGPMSVSRTAPGAYVVTLSGLAGTSGTVHVTPYGDSGAQCSTSVFGPVSKADQGVWVSCNGPKGEARDTMFTLTYLR